MLFSPRLLLQRYVSEAELIDTLSAQLKVEARHLDYSALRREDVELIVECACREHLMVVADASLRPVVVAAAVVGDVRMKGWLDANFPFPYRLVLAGRRNIVDVIEKANEARLRRFTTASLHSSEAPRQYTLN